MPSAFSLIGSSWSFLKRQPVFSNILFWLLFLPPSVLQGWLFALGPDRVEFSTGWLSAEDPLFIPYFLAFMTMLVLCTWGAACVLVVGERLLKSKAGRTRTSFASVRKQAWRFVAPLLLTGILRLCITVLWSVLLIVPGVLYSIRTVLYQVALVSDGKQYREALHASTALVKGNTWQTLYTVVIVNVLVFLPSWVLDFGTLFFPVAREVDLALSLVANAFTAVSATLSLLSLILLYGHFRGDEPAVE